MEAMNVDGRCGCNRTARAFTLVELLVVIGVVAILLLPAQNKARRYSQQLACTSQLRQIVLASMQYAADNKNRIPSAGIRAALFRTMVLPCSG